VTLSVGQLPAHNHQVSGTTSTDGNHDHTYQDIYFSETWGAFGNAGWIGSGDSDRNNGPLHFGGTTAASGSHNHSFNVTSASTGSGQAIDKLPTFYALAFIMRVK
jgi:hypothetical protein